MNILRKMAILLLIAGIGQSLLAAPQFKIHNSSGKQIIVQVRIGRPDYQTVISAFGLNAGLSREVDLKGKQLWSIDWWVDQGNFKRDEYRTTLSGSTMNPSIMGSFTILPDGNFIRNFVSNNSSDNSTGQARQTFMLSME